VIPEQIDMSRIYVWKKTDLQEAKKRVDEAHDIISELFWNFIFDNHIDDKVRKRLLARPLIKQALKRRTSIRAL
jgi:hypothetical protein